MARNFKKHEENTRKYATQIDNIQCAKSICYFKRIEPAKLLQNPIKYIPFNMTEQIKVYQDYTSKL